MEAGNHNLTGNVLAMALHAQSCMGARAPRATLACRATPAAFGAVLYKPRSSAVCSAVANEHSGEALASLTRRGLLAGAALSPLALQQQPAVAAGDHKAVLITADLPCWPWR